MERQIKVYRLIMDITEDTKECNLNGVSVETDKQDGAKTKGKIGTRQHNKNYYKVIVYRTLRMLRNVRLYKATSI